MYCQDLKGREDPYSLLPFSRIGYRSANANQFFKVRTKIDLRRLAF